MDLVRNFVIFVAKILIFIGDVVIMIFSFLWKTIKAALLVSKKINARIPGSITKLKQRIRIPHRVVEKEIYSIEEDEPKISLPSIELPTFDKPNFSKPNINFTIPEIKLPTFHLPKLKVERITIVIPTFKFPKVIKPTIILPAFKFPTIKLPELKLPSISLPKLHMPTISLPKPTLPHPYLHHKKRGRKRIHPLILPFRTRFKYIFAGSVVSLLFIFLPMWTLIFLQNLPNPKELATQDISQTTKIYDRNHILLYQIYANQNRTVVPLSEIPKDLQNATIAIEDQNFYTTPGFDLFAIVRSAIADVKGEPLQGGSTITQQLIKARLLTPERSIDRKVKEIVLSVWAQRIYTKDQIMEMYLNQVPYGGTSWGAEAAAQTYFGKSVKDLDLAQSAFLAGLPQAPSIYSPYGDSPNEWKSRQIEVLKRMRNEGFITPAEESNAVKEKIAFEPYQHIIHAPHFVMYIKERLIEKYGLPAVERGGLTVTTTLDLKTEDLVQKIIADEVNNGSYLNFTNGAALVTNPKNGDILAMVGGKDYYDPAGGNYNVTTALRQPGSTIKVITYSAALTNGYTAATMIQDTPVSFAAPGAPPYSPVNYDGRYHGNMTLRNALGNSINIPAVKTLNQIGIGTMVNLAKKMGISTWGEPSNYGLALTLGAAEVKMTDMATAYGSLANQGRKVELNPILKVTDYRGNVLEEKKDIKETTVLPDNVAFIVSNILADNNARSLEFGLNSPLNIPGHTVSVKTGTTDNKRDNWTIGYTPNILTAVWVGNNNNTPMNPILASGITGAAPIWNKIMTNLLSKENPKEEIYTPPANIVSKPCGGKKEYFVRGTESLGNCRPISINDQRPTINP